MKISPHITLALISLSFPMLLGCASFERGVPQKVIILSFPTEASIYVNGDAVGITPMEMSLPRKVVHEIRLEKNGFNSAVKYFAPVPNDKAHNFVRFGLMEDFGYYVDFRFHLVLLEIIEPILINEFFLIKLFSLRIDPLPIKELSATMQSPLISTPVEM